MAFFSRSLHFLVFLFYNQTHGVSGEQPNSHYQNTEQSENQERRPTAEPLEDGIQTRGERIIIPTHLRRGECGRRPTPLQSGEPRRSSTPSRSSFPYVDRMREAHRVAVPVIRDYSRAPNGLPRDGFIAPIPVVNSIPPWLLARIWRISSSSVSHPNQPQFYPHLYPNRVSSSLPGQPFQRNVQMMNGYFVISRNAVVNQNQPPEPRREINVPSDNEEDNINAPVEMLDLTLKL